MPKKPDVNAIEFLKGRIYLGAYDVAPRDAPDAVYFTVETSLPYNAFHLDFGPLHLGQLYRFAVSLHHILNDETNAGRAVVLYLSKDARSRANAACLLACYMVLVQLWAPHQVLQPLAQADPPFMPFRDAGYLHADFELSIQDVVYGLWRAKERGMIDLTTFNLEEYERYERVDQGDLNAVSKDFIAFASPQQSRPGAALNEPFRLVVDYFQTNDVQLVVRLNSHLYDAAEFTNRNIQHIDMIFDDGTCPPMLFVHQFIGAAETVIANGGKIAVHCKAGLGRTGCLIGAHLIYTHGFTANECIAYMRMVRPGMVVGPQQHWLYLHQNEFRNWRHTMCLDDVGDSFIGGLYALVDYAEFKKRARRSKEQQSNDEAETSFTPVRRRILGAPVQFSQAVPSQSPIQPRKGTTRRSDASGEYAANHSGIANNSDDDDYDVQDVLESPVKRAPRRAVSEFVQGTETGVATQRAVSAFGGSPRGDSVSLTRTKIISTTTTMIQGEKDALNKARRRGGGAGGVRKVSNRKS